MFRELPDILNFGFLRTLQRRYTYKSTFIMHSMQALLRIFLELPHLTLQRLHTRDRLRSLILSLLLLIFWAVSLSNSAMPTSQHYSRPKIILYSNSGFQSCFIFKSSCDYSTHIYWYLNRVHACYHIQHMVNLRDSFRVLSPRNISLRSFLHYLCLVYWYLPTLGCNYSMQTIYPFLSFYSVPSISNGL